MRSKCERREVLLRLGFGIELLRKAECGRSSLREGDWRLPARPGNSWREPLRRDRPSLAREQARPQGSGPAKVHAAGRKRVRPVLVLTSSRGAREQSEDRALAFRRERPATGAAKSRKVTAEETGLPGRPKKHLVPFCLDEVSGAARQIAKDRRLAGLDADAGEVKASSGAGQCGFDKIEFACGDAAGDEQEVSGGRAGKGSIEGFGVVAGDGQDPGIAAGGGDHSRQHGAARVANLAGAGRGADGHKLVAGGEDGDARLQKDIEFGRAAGSGKRDLRRGDQRSRREEVYRLFAPVRRGRRCFRLSEWCAMVRDEWRGWMMRESPRRARA